MPAWGLTSEQCETKPWGLDPNLLRPCKTITDPVHDDVYINRLERLLIDSPSMQRLRRVKQLGTTHLVYPGATHSRWSHSIGTLRAAQDLLDAVWNSRTNPHAQHEAGNLLVEWAALGEDYLNEQFARATVLARLGGLLHDLCHVPVGHTIEDDLGILTPHDENAARFERLWAGLDPVARDAIEGAEGLFQELRVLIISKDQHAKEFTSEYPFVGDIVGNTICADLMDYIRRDHRNTGLPLSLGHRFLDSFFVSSSAHPYHPKKMVISIERNGLRRADIVTELVKYLRYRYELTERVLTHHAKTAADAMVGKMLGLWFDDLCDEVAAGASPEQSALSTLHVLVGDDQAEATPQVVGEVEERARRCMEDEFLRRSDDGVFEHVLDRRQARPDSENAAAAGALAESILERDLFKTLGHAGHDRDRAIAKQIHEKFGTDPKVRRALESAAADYAGIDAAWKVVVWLPSPAMRLKVAEVLVNTRGEYVAPLYKVEPASQEIVEQHQKLWGITVYAPQEVTKSAVQRDAALSYLGEKMGIRFSRPDGTEVPGKETLVIDLLIDEFPTLSNKRSVLQALLPAASVYNETFRGLQGVLRRAAEDQGLISASDGPGSSG